MTPDEFQRKWQGHALTERQAYQLHFCDLCELIGHPKPSPDATKSGSFCFEKHVSKQWGGDGFADVWKRDFFGWEYKGLHADLDKALQQLVRYRRDLENPPLLVVCDTDVIQIHTDFDRTANTVYAVSTAGLVEPEQLDIVRRVFHDPSSLRPGRTPDQVTQEVAARIGEVATTMRERGLEPHHAAHFLMRLVFTMFAEDIGLLRRGLISEILESTRDDPETLENVLRQLFGAMATGGRLLVEKIDHFDGGLFEDDATVRLDPDEIAALAAIARDDWSQVEPAIFGTLFERGLDPSRRAQLGAHYTSKEDILLVIEPVLMKPLREEWARIRAECDAVAKKAESAKTTAARQKHRTEIGRRVREFMERLASVKVLDPACGSGNFLYVALNALKDLELEVIQATADWSAEAPFPAVDPGQLYGLEIDTYAVELAQLTVWIGYLQWCQRHGFLGSDRPLLRKHDNIKQMDAILPPLPPGEVGPERSKGSGEGRHEVSLPPWPEADVIVGNPPFLGDKKLRAELGDEYVQWLFRTYSGLVPHGADLCCYWFERARAQISAGRAKRAGLLATNSIRQGKNRAVLDQIAADGGMFMAWSDREWILDGAAVRISIIGFDKGTETGRALDGRPVRRINADLTSTVDLTQAKRLKAGSGIALLGNCKGGPFDITAEQAQQLLALPTNPNGRPNSDVVRPYVNGMDLMRRSRGAWIIDLHGLSVREASLYEGPFEYVRATVHPVRARNRDRWLRQNWWLPQRARPEMRKAIAGRRRFIVTAASSRHRVFHWVDARVLPDHQLVVFAREEDWFFGVLHSRAHTRWSLKTCSWLGSGNDPRYTPTLCFETFPFPCPTDEQRQAISAAAKALTDMRQSALDNDTALTMTALYNKRATWLDSLHKDLDQAVLAAYGWPEDITDEVLLERLLALNLERAEEEAKGVVRRP